jgi:lysozyme
MENTEQLLTKIKDKIKFFEGYDSRPYLCPEGYLTIGYGFNYDSNPLPANTPKHLLTSLFEKGFTEELAEWLLDHFVQAAFGTARTFTWFEKLNTPRKAVIVDMLYQMNHGKLLKFRKMLDALNKGDYTLAAHEMRDSKWYEQSGRRSAMNVQQMLTGNWVDAEG